MSLKKLVHFHFENYQKSRLIYCLQRRRNSLKLKRSLDRCSFYDNGGVKIGSYSQLAKFDVPSVWDIEDIVNLGIKKSSCPYYGTRLLLKTADIVFCPYNYIIDPVIRSTVSFLAFNFLIWI